MTALREDVRADSRLIIQQGTFVRIGWWRVHAGTEIHKDSRVSLATLDDDRRGIGTETGGMDEIFGGEDADLRGPLQRRERLIERQTDRVVVGDEAWCFTG